MSRELGDGYDFGDGRDEFLGFARRAGADGIAKRYFVAAQTLEHAGHITHPLRLNLAFIRATQDAGDVAADAHPVRSRLFRDRPRALQALGNRAVDVLARERFSRGDEYRDFVAMDRKRRFQSLHVGRQHRVAHARLLANRRHDLCGIGHLRHPLRRHEARCLDRRQSRISQAIDQSHLDIGGDGSFFVLQAVPWTDFDDAHTTWQWHGSESL